MTDYRAVARSDAIKYGIDPDVFVAQIEAESGFNPNAISSAGAIGIAQFMPSTASSLGVNPSDPLSALDGAAKLDAANFKRYGSMDKMLAAYNAGPGAVDASLRYGSGWMNQLPLETQNYIHKILSSLPSSGSSSLDPITSIKNTIQSASADISTGVDWLASPSRIVKMVSGIVLVIGSLYLLIKKPNVGRMIKNAASA